MSLVYAKAGYYYGVVQYRNSEKASGNLKTGTKGPFYVSDRQQFDKAYKEFVNEIYTLRDLQMKIENNRKTMMDHFSGDNLFPYTRHQPYGSVSNWNYFAFEHEPAFPKEKDYRDEGNAFIFFYPQKIRFEISQQGRWEIKLLSSNGDVLKTIHTELKANKENQDLSAKCGLYPEQCELVCNGIKAEYLYQHKGFSKYIIRISDGNSIESDALETLFSKRGY